MTAAGNSAQNGSYSWLETGSIQDAFETARQSGASSQVGQLEPEEGVTTSGADLLSSESAVEDADDQVVPDPSKKA